MSHNPQDKAVPLGGKLYLTSKGLNAGALARQSEHVEHVHRIKYPLTTARLEDDEHGGVGRMRLGLPHALEAHQRM